MIKVIHARHRKVQQVTRDGTTHRQTLAVGLVLNLWAPPLSDRSVAEAGLGAGI